MTGKEISNWVDKAMYPAEPLDAATGPTVTLLNMTPDPLGAIAASTLIYEGRVIRNLSEVTDEDRVRCFEQIQKTRLQAPFEYVDFHFLIEGVTRSFTHQMVRQRTAVYSQESLRFAVKEDAAQGVALPPSLAGTKAMRGALREGQHRLSNEDIGRLSESERQRMLWDNAVESASVAYDALVNSGMPAEDARGLLPHSITTRLHYKTNLRNLLEHSGNRLCTQAQHEWKTVFALIKKAIREYDPYENVTVGFNGYSDHWIEKENSWQYPKIADMFLPICYQLGKCGFKASFDRPCKIRERVDAREAINSPSSEWDTVKDLGMPNAFRSLNFPWFRAGDGHDIIPAIRPAEWLLDPFAAREKK